MRSRDHRREERLPPSSTRDASTPPKNAIQRGLSSGHVSLRFIKKLSFVFLAQEAPQLVEPFLQSAAAPRRAADVGMPVLEVILELAQNVRRPPGADDPSSSVGHTSPPPGPRDRGGKSVWDVPPRYERLRSDQQSQRAAQARTMIEASRAPWGGSGGSTGTLPISGRHFSAAFPIELDPREMVTLEDPDDVREHHIAIGACIDVSAEELLRQPPHVAAYRLLSLSDCPAQIQERSRIDDEWLYRTISEGARGAAGGVDGGMPLSDAYYSELVDSVVSSVKSRLFLCWCQLFGDNGQTLLFSDAVVMERPSFSLPEPTPERDEVGRVYSPTSAPASSRQRDGSPSVVVSPATSALRGASSSPNVDSAPKRNLPIHYLQEKLRRQHAAGNEREKELTDAQRFLKIVAERQLLLQLELRDHHLAQRLLPHSYQDDRLGLPRAGLELPHDRIDVGHAVEVWSKGLRHRGQASSMEHAHSFRRSSGAALRDSSFGRSPSEMANNGRAPSTRLSDNRDIERSPSEGHRREAVDNAGGRSFLVGDDEETYCVPKRRVRMGELGRHVDVPGDPTSLVSLSTFWQQNVSIPFDEEVALKREAMMFAAASGAPRNAVLPIHAVASSSRPPPVAAQAVSGGRHRRRSAGTGAGVQHNAKRFNTIIPESPIAQAMLPDAMTEYAPGRPWHRQRAFAQGADDDAPLGDEEPPFITSQAETTWNSHSDPLDHLMVHNSSAAENACRDDHLVRRSDDATPPTIPLTHSVSFVDVPADHASARSVPNRASANAQRVESILVSTVRELAPLRDATEDLVMATHAVGRTIEVQLAHSAEYRERNRTMLTQAKNLEATLETIETRLKALCQ